MKKSGHDYRRHILRFLPILLLMLTTLSVQAQQDLTVYELTEQEEYIRSTEDSAARYELLKIEHKAQSKAYESAKTVIREQSESLRLSGVQNKLQIEDLREQIDREVQKGNRKLRIGVLVGLAVAVIVKTFTH